jgi:hypothetical protein
VSESVSDSDSRFLNTASRLLLVCKLTPFLVLHIAPRLLMIDNAQLVRKLFDCHNNPPSKLVLLQKRYHLLPLHGLQPAAGAQRVIQAPPNLDLQPAKYGPDFETVLKELDFVLQSATFLSVNTRRNEASTVLQEYAVGNYEYKTECPESGVAESGRVRYKKDARCNSKRVGEDVRDLLSDEPTSQFKAKRTTYGTQ